MTEKCEDKKCFKHGGLKLRGETSLGQVVSAKAKHTVIVEMAISKFFSKYRKWGRGRRKTVAHNPPCINAKVGDMVELAETRKLSKTKAWTVTGLVTEGGYVKGKGG